MKSNYFGPPCQTVAALFVLTLFAVQFLAAQDAFSRGQDLFMRNNPADAVPLLESTVAEDPANIKAFLYLGIAYEQLGKIDDAIAVFRKALPRAGSMTADVAFNIGNAYFAKGGASFAVPYYDQALQADQGYAPAYLNRANAKIKTGDLKGAVTDYEAYLGLEPATPKRKSIEDLLALIRGDFAAQEKQQAAAAEAAKADEERRKKLLDEVSSSLQQAAEETKGLQAGSENVQQYEGEFELE